MQSWYLMSNQKILISFISFSFFEASEAQNQRTLFGTRTPSHVEQAASLQHDDQTASCCSSGSGAQEKLASYPVAPGVVFRQNTSSANSRPPRLFYTGRTSINDLLELVPRDSTTRTCVSDYYKAGVWSLWTWLQGGSWILAKSGRLVFQVDPQWAETGWSLIFQS